MRSLAVSQDELWAYHLAVHERRDQRARAALVEEYRPNAIALARRLHRDREPLEDLVQVALEALLVAIDRFDPGRGMPFLAYATPTIVGTIKRHYRDRGWSMRVPRRVHELSGPIRVTVDHLEQDLGRPPTVEEVADHLDLDADEVRATLLATRTRAMDSTDVVDGDGRSFEAPSSEPGYERIDLADALERATAQIDDRHRQVLDLYYRHELTQTQIAQRVGCSQMHVSRMLQRTLLQLRREMESDLVAVQ